MKAVIFDMDGLLVDSEPFWRKAEIEAFAELGVVLTEADCRHTMGWRLNEVVHYWHARRPWEGPTPEAVEQDILRRVSHYVLTEAEPLTGVFAAIDMCRKAGLKTAIASSSPMVLIESVVERFGLHGYFDTLHSAQYEAYGKPHPAVFLHTAGVLGIHPTECMVLEDSFHGMVAGLAAKMHVVVVPAPEAFASAKWAAAHVCIPSLEQFGPVLKAALD